MERNAPLPSNRIQPQLPVRDLRYFSGTIIGPPAGDMLNMGHRGIIVSRIERLAAPAADWYGQISMAGGPRWRPAGGRTGTGPGRLRTSGAFSHPL